MSRPRVLLLLPFFREPERGESTGGLISNFHLVRALSTRFSVQVLSLDPHVEPNETTATEHGYSVLWSPTPDFGRGRIHFRWKGYISKQVRLAIEAWGAPTISIATTSTICALPKLREQGSKSVALIRAYENFGWRVPSGTIAERWSSFRRSWKQGRSSVAAIRAADLVIANSAFMQEQVRRVFSPRSVKILYPCIDLENEAGLPDLHGANRVGFVSRGARKNISIVQRIARRLPGVEFHVFGHLPTLTSDAPNIVPHGWYKSRIQMFSTAGLWIVPSRWQEPFGRVASEALVLGRKVLVSSQGGLPEAVHDSSMVVRSTTPDQWALAIQRSLSASISEAKRRETRCRILERYGRKAHDATAATLVGSLLD